jgi:hypothetical protein
MRQFLLKEYHLLWRGGFCAPMTWRATLVGAQAPGRTTHARQVKRYRPRKCSPWSSRLGAGHGVNDPTREKCTVMNQRGCQDQHMVSVSVMKKMKHFYNRTSTAAKRKFPFLFSNGSA